MSNIPIFSLPTIKFEKDKDRKQFILDCISISTAISILYVALNEDFSEGVKPLHKNKHRKNIAKIQEAYDYLRKKQVFLFDLISHRDLQTIKFKTHSRAFLSFIENISQTDKDISLEYLAITIIDVALNSLDRKAPLQSYLKNFLDYKLLYEKIGSNIEEVGYEIGIELELAKKFIKNLKY